MQRTPNEAQIQLSEDLKDLLIDLAIDDQDLSGPELQDIEDSMDDVVGLIFDALKIKVVSVDGEKLVCEISLLANPEEG